MILPSQIIPLLLLAGHTRAVQFVCHDGSVATCGDGTAPLLHEGLFARGDLGSRSMCPESCNVFKNKCAATAPTCIYPNPQVPNPRAACACRPGFKADGVADGDTTKHWRVPVTGQEHRVWVAEGVSCNMPCGGYGAQSCLEVTMLGPDCLGDVVPGQKYPGMVNPGSGSGGYNVLPSGKNTSTAHFAGGIPGKETGGPKGKETGGPKGKETGGPKGKETGGPKGKETGGPKGKETGGPKGKETGGPKGKETGGPKGKETGGPKGKETGGPKGIPTGFPFPDGDEFGKTVVDSASDSEPTESLDPGSSSPSTSDATSGTESGSTDRPGNIPQATKDANFYADLFHVSDMPLQTGEASKEQSIPDYLSEGADPAAPATEKEDTTMPFKMPTKRSEPQRRDYLTDIRTGGLQRAWTIAIEEWNWIQDMLSTRHSEFKMEKRPELCWTIRDAIKDACENAIDTENTNCNLEFSARDPNCARYLTKECCENKYNEGYWCNGRWSNYEFGRAINERTSSCGISTAGGREALKLGIYHRLLGPLQTIMQEANPAPPFLQKAAEKQQKWLLWETDLRNLVGGDPYLGVSGLEDITWKLYSSGLGYDGVKWSEAIEELLSEELDAFMLESIGMAFDVFAVGSEREYLVWLNQGTVPPASDIAGIRAWADGYVKKYINYFLPGLGGQFDWQTTQAEVDATLEQYKKFLEKYLFWVGRAWAVVPRADRVLAE